jgi:hypothetical protein
MYTEVRSRNYSWRGKAIFLCVRVGMGVWALVFACARVALSIQHATHRHIISCGLFGSTNFSTFSHKRNDFRGGGGRGACMFCFYVQLLFETFLILRRIQRETDVNVKTSSPKVPVITGIF